jgi:hypothetical protein
MARRVYTEQDQAEALMMLVLCRGNAEEACRRMKAEAMTPPPSRTLKFWRARDHARYEQIRTEVTSKLTEQVANQAEQIMLKAGDVEELMIDRLHAALVDGRIPDKDLPGALRNVSTTKALNNDKIAGPIRGRPTVIHSDRTADEIMRALKALEPNLIIEGTAEEILDTQQLPAA